MKNISIKTKGKKQPCHLCTLEKEDCKGMDCEGFSPKESVIFNEGLYPYKKS